MTTQPPRIAAWLLRLFGGSSKHNEALLGDVNERYQQDRSSIWYWRQTVAVTFAEIRNRILAIGRTAMKRAAVWTIAMVGVFFVGFRVGRIPSKLLPEANVALGTNPAIAEYVNRVGQNIAKISDAKVPFTIKVVRSDDNVVPLPGGFFYVNSGLILESDTIQKR